MTGRRMGAAGLVIAAASIVTACSEDDLLFAGQPRLVLTPAPGPLTWGRVIPGDGAEAKSIQLRNSGIVALTVNDVRVVGRDRALFTTSTLPDRIVPGQREILAVNLSTPRLFDSLQAELHIETDDPDRPDAVYPLSALLQPRCVLIAEPAEIRTRRGQAVDISVRAAEAASCRLVRVGVDSRYFRLEPPLLSAVHLEPGQVWSSRVTQTEVGVPPESQSIRFISSEGPGAGLRIVPEVGAFDCVRLEPDEATFPGPLFIGQTSTRTFELSNDCDEAFPIEGLYTDDETFTARPIPPVVEAHSTLPITVTFTPERPGQHFARMLIYTADPGRPQVQAYLTGTADEAEVFVLPSMLTFADVPYQSPGPDAVSACGSAVRSLAIYNATPDSVTVDHLTVNGVQRFTVIGATLDRVAMPPLGMTIPPLSRATVDLRFFPSRTAPFTHRATLTATIGGTVFDIPLKGDTADNGAREERFNQSSSPRTDVLFVVDQSGSMRQERARLERNLGTFLAQAARTESDLRIGITTVEGGANAGTMHACQPHPAYIDPSYADPQTRSEALVCALNTLPEGSPNEEGLFAALRGLQRGLDPVAAGPRRDPNAGFVRADANLAVIIVSDEDDQSSGTHEAVVADLNLIKANHAGTEIVLHAIVGDPIQTGCAQALPAPRYAAIARQLGGAVHSICLEDWNPILESLGRRVVATFDRFPLAERAAAETLSVTVDGVAIGPDPQDGFTYDRAQNAVVLHGVGRAPPGAEVVIEYEIGCDP